MTQWNNIADGELGSSAFGKINTTGCAVYSGWTPMTETLSFYSADAPTYLVSSGSGTDISTVISPGMKMMMTQGGVVQKGFCTAVSGSVATLYMGTDYSLATGSAISVPYFSTEKAPYGFPLDPEKWSFTATDTSNIVQATPIAGTWYNMGSIVINAPIGAWRGSYRLLLRTTTGGQQNVEFMTALSTSASSVAPDDRWQYSHGWAGVTCTTITNIVFYPEKSIMLTEKTPIYLIESQGYASMASMTIYGNVNATTISLVCAYL
jgi:hypothetical protein